MPAYDAAIPGSTDELSPSSGPDPTELPSASLGEADAQHLELVLSGLYAPGARYLDSAERAGVVHDGRLPDGTPWDLPLALRVPDAVAVVGSRVLLRDPEHVPLAVLDITDVETDADGTSVVAGPLTRVGSRSSGTFARLEATAAVAGATRPLLVVPTDRPLHAHDLDAVAEHATRLRAGVVLLGLVGSGRPTPRDVLARALLACGDALRGRTRPPGVRVALLSLPALAELPDLAPRRANALVVRLAAALGGTGVLLPGVEGTTAALPRTDLPVPVSAGPPSPLTCEALDSLLAAGADLPAEFTPEGVERELRRLHPPTLRRGAVLMFTGLSGSGKSTVAAGVADALAEEGTRSVTVLDGDVVRTMLSAGLSFSRADRDLNVRRIGFVAAEVARHGGTAICAPIAPYESVRAEVRAMVEAAGGVFVLVHVSTPLEVCEARDRKGLYAKARAGLIPEFTGVSDPYEIPDAADLAVDTSVVSLPGGVDRVMGLLRQRGLVRG